MRPEHITEKKVLYGCLDWGSGHVARSIPLILQLEKQGNQVFFCGLPEQYSVLKSYGFSGTFLDLPATGFRFKGDGNFVLEALRNFLPLRKAILRDRRRVEAFAKTYGIDLIISDHRYGVRSAAVPSIFVTHQVQLPPGTNRVAESLHEKWMSRFDTVWIMDDPADRIADLLSASDDEAVYIGHYSRFEGIVAENVVRGSITAIISGPEPYAKQLFEAMLALASGTQNRWTIVCAGAYAENVQLENGRVIRNDWKAADEAIISAERIISRNGYSTLMDLKALNKKAIFFPTPGQPEQAYLRTINRNADWDYVNSIAEIDGKLKM